jgi:large subunit ribosomal protein L21
MGSKSVSTQNAYAIVAAGGKQHRVKVGQQCCLEKIVGEPGESVELDKVLLLAHGDSVKLGAPYVEGSKVMAKIVEQGRGEKIRIFKMRRRKGYRRTQGHRQDYTKVEITSIK